MSTAQLAQRFHHTALSMMFSQRHGTTFSCRSLYPLPCASIMSCISLLGVSALNLAFRRYDIQEPVDVYQVYSPVWGLRVPGFWRSAA
jgi:hypothetical protein